MLQIHIKIGLKHYGKEQRNKMLSSLIKDLQKLRNPKKAKVLQGFFKTGKGKYGEGDFFLGISVPDQRKIAKKYIGLSLPRIQQLLKSKVHEYRLTAILILVLKYQKADQNEKSRIFNFYLKNTKYINNWDLVDVSAPNIVGNFLLNKDKKVLHKFAKSRDLWEKRIAIVSTFTFIKEKEFGNALRISEILLKDKNDLIHKGVGWMLREIGKRDKKILENFLKENYKIMPRTMLRYAIEKFDEKERKRWLKGV